MGAQVGKWALVVATVTDANVGSNVAAAEWTQAGEDIVQSEARYSATHATSIEGSRLGSSISDNLSSVMLGRAPPVGWVNIRPRKN